MSRGDRVGVTGGATGSAQARPHPGLLALGYLLFAAAGAMTATIEVLLVPSRLGQTLIPLAPALAVLSNVALPAISRGLTDTMVSAVPPVAGWLVTTFLLASATPEGDVLLPAGDTAITSYSLLGLGTLAGLATIWLANRPGAWTGRWLSSRLARSGSDNDGGR
ncbi:MAG TPA: hypothetical protein VGB75_13865 [Jatrophihabitans sp.]|uniref:hypothetical protein n=1 Tax=Jatrophihabitans sp. TaxID=1932789 RepID=UPI002EFA91E2